MLAFLETTSGGKLDLAMDDVDRSGLALILRMVREALEYETEREMQS